MRHVDRSRVPTPRSLQGQPDSAGHKELTANSCRVQAFRARQQPSDPPALEFSAYKAADVTDALNTLFGGKCAYCESRYSATQPVDREHWRPKGQARQRPEDAVDSRMGYWWLAARWDNLLASCIECNRMRWQMDVSGDRGRRGKADAFPVADVRMRARTPGGERRERPLLLNPCVDDPQATLCALDGDPAALGVRADAPDPERGEVSIEIYGLNRSALVEERRRLATAIEGEIARVDELIGRLQDCRQTGDRGPRLDDVRKDIVGALGQLKVRLRDDHPYLLVARSLIAPYMTQLFGEIGLRTLLRDTRPA